MMAVANYAGLVISLNGIDEIKDKIWPLKRPEKEKGIPCIVYHPLFGTNTEALDGWKQNQTVQIDLLATTFETLTRLQDRIVSKLYHDGVIAQAAEAPFMRWEKDLTEVGLFVASTDVVIH